MVSPDVFCQLDQISVGNAGAPRLSEVSLVIRKGESVVLYGPSGGGKSTLLKMVLGGSHWFTGTYRVNGQEVDERTVESVRHTMAYIPQQPEFGRDTVQDVLRRPFSWRAYRMNSFSAGEAIRWLEKLGLDSAVLGMPCGQLSGGQRQRIAIVRALMSGRKVLVADEPTSALDEAACEKTMAVLLNGQYTVISASHDPRWIQRCQRGICIQDGKVVKDQSVSEALMREVCL